MRQRRFWMILLIIIPILLLLFWYFFLKPNPGNPEQKKEQAISKPTQKETPNIDLPKREVATPEPLQLTKATVEKDESLQNGQIAGKVISWSTGKGIEGAELNFLFDGNFFSTSTESEGNFVFTPEKVGTYRLSVVSAEGFLPYAPQLGESSIVFTARPAYKISDITIYLKPAIPYRGLVLSPDEKPIEGAEIELLHANSGEQTLVGLPSSFVSDKEGRFIFSAPDYALLEASHPDFDKGAAVLDSAAQISHELVITLPNKGPDYIETGTISGIVLDFEGNPIEGAQIDAVVSFQENSRQEEGPIFPVKTFSDSSGEFSLRLTKTTETYQLIARHPDYGIVRENGVKISTNDLQLIFSPAGRITGQVLEKATQNPVPSSTVVVLRQEGSLRKIPVKSVSVFDPEGYYEIAGLLPGEYLVVAQAAGFSPSTEKSVQIKKDVSAKADLFLGKGGSISGMVIDTETKAPLQYARVSLEGGIGDGPSAVSTVNSVVTNEEGKFLLEGVQPGTRSVTATAYQHHIRIVSGLQIQEDVKVGPITIELSPLQEGEEAKIELAGIGAALAAGDDSLIIQQVLPGGGAEEAGLIQGDNILAIDDLEVVTLGMTGSIEKIRGPEGSVVRLKIRKNDGDIIDLDVNRKKIRS